MPPKEMMKQENPWVVSNIQEFLYYNCPECDTKEKDSELFVQHALDHHELSKTFFNQPEKDNVPQNQDEVINDKEMEEIRDVKPTQEELNLSDQKFMQLRLFKLKVEPDVLLKVSDAKADLAQDMDYEPGSESDSDVDIPAEDEDDVNPGDEDVKPDAEDVKPDAAAFCDKCDKFFKSTLSLKVHITMKHSEQRIKCDQCDTRKANNDSMAKHCRLKHFNSVSCHKCEYKCHSKLMLEAHWKTFHKLRYRFDADNEGNFTCKVCILKTQNEEEMKYHQWEHQDIKWAYKCEICEATFSRKSLYEKHKDVVHMGILPYKCDECDLNFKKIDQLRSHRRKVHEPPPTHICTVCGKSVLYLKEHIKKMHPEKKDEGGTCEQCGLFFEKKHLLMQHKHRFHTRKFQVCTICEKFFVGNKKQKLIDHYTDEHAVFCNKNTIYVCDICKTKVTSAKDLSEHYHAVHESKDEFQCSKCDHKEPTRALLSIHCIDMHEMNPFNESELVNEKTVQAIQVHEDDKAYQCTLCSKKLASKVTLNQHMKQMHDKSNHVKCDLCPRTFIFPSQLKKHILMQHTARTKFPCNQCSYVTNRKVDLDRHFRRVHEKNYRLKCDVCEKPIEDLYNLQRHMLKAHDILYKY